MPKYLIILVVLTLRCGVSTDIATDDAAAKPSADKQSPSDANEQAIDWTLKGPAGTSFAINLQVPDFTDDATFAVIDSNAAGTLSDPNTGTITYRSSTQFAGTEILSFTATVPDVEAVRLNVSITTTAISFDGNYDLTIGHSKKSQKNVSCEAPKIIISHDSNTLVIGGYTLTCHRNDSYKTPSNISVASRSFRFENTKLILADSETDVEYGRIYPGEVVVDRCPSTGNCNKVSLKLNDQNDLTYLDRSSKFRAQDYEVSGTLTAE